MAKLTGSRDAGILPFVTSRHPPAVTPVAAGGGAYLFDAALPEDPGQGQRQHHSGAVTQGIDRLPKVKQHHGGPVVRNLSVLSGPGLSRREDGLEAGSPTALLRKLDVTHRRIFDRSRARS